MASTVVTKSDLARRLKISASRVSAFVQRGLPQRPDGLLDQAVALDWIEKNIARTERRRPIVGGKPNGRPPLAPPKDGSASYSEARRLLEVLKAQRLKLQVDALRGRLVEREQIVTEVFELGRTYRDAWLNWPSRVAALLAAKWGIGDALKVQRDLDAEVRSHLHALSDFTLDGAVPNGGATRPD
jgi:hypothetical protein